VLEVACFLVAKDTKVANNLSHSVRICLVVLRLVVNLIPKLLHLDPVLQLGDIMSVGAGISIAGTIEITRLRSRGSRFWI